MPKLANFSLPAQDELPPRLTHAAHSCLPGPEMHCIILELYKKVIGTLINCPTFINSAQTNYGAIFMDVVNKTVAVRSTRLLRSSPDII